MQSGNNKTKDTKISSLFNNIKRAGECLDRKKRAS